MWPGRAKRLSARLPNSSARAIPSSICARHGTERAEILEARMPYYGNDLLVMSWSAAMVYDTDEGAAPTIQLLEYANTQ